MCTEGTYSAAAKRREDLEGSHVGLRRNVQDAQFCMSCGRLQDLLAFGNLSFGRSESCNLVAMLIDLYR
jgi:hypothetical protein